MNTYIVIDDEPLTRMGTIKKIGDLGGTIECIGQASNGAEGIELIKNLDPDIIITDMNMPIMDGVGLLEYLCKNYSEKQIIVISGFKDFEYARAAIHAKAVSYLLKPFSRDDIQNEIKDALKMLRTVKTERNKLIEIEEQRESANYQLDLNLARNLILGYESSADSAFISKRFNTLSEMSFYSLFTVYSKKVLEKTNLEEIFSDSIVLNSVFIQHPNSKDLGFCLCYYNSESDEKKCTEFANRILAELEHGTAFIGMSGRKSHNDSLNSAYNETLQALNTNNDFENNRTFFYHDVGDKTVSFNWEKEYEFLFRIEAGDSPGVHLLLDDLFGAFRARISTIGEIKYYCADLIQKSRTIFNRYFDNLSSGEISASVQNILNLIFDIDEMKQYVSQVLSNIAKNMKPKSVYGSENIIQNIRTYIEKNYRNNITLDIIASLFSINSTYLSHLFKEKSGENFVDYLNCVRIEKAKQLLSNSDTKMYQIAKAVGYDNVKYFFRIFKKIAGITPQQYRNKAEK